MLIALFLSSSVQGVHLALNNAVARWPNPQPTGINNLHAHLFHACNFQRFADPRNRYLQASQKMPARRLARDQVRQQARPRLVEGLPLLFVVRATRLPTRSSWFSALRWHDCGAASGLFRACSLAATQGKKHYQKAVPGPSPRSRFLSILQLCACPRRATATSAERGSAPHGKRKASGGALFLI